MRTISMVSQKGGTGKTTLAVHLAVLAEQEGETVLLIDLDPQGSATAWAEVRGKDAPIVLAGDPARLPSAIEKAREMGVTLVIVDSAPHVNGGALAAIRAADTIVLPVRPSFFDVAALRETVDLLEKAEKKSAAIAVINAVPAGGGDADDAEEALRQLGITACKARVGQRAPFSNAIPEGKGVTEFAARDKATEEMRALWQALGGTTSGKSKSKAKVKS